MSSQIGFAMVPNWMVRDPRVGSKAMLVYLVLSSHAGRDGISFPGQQLIADESGLSESSVKRGLAELRALGLIESWVVVTAMGRRNHYRLMVHTLPRDEVKSEGGQVRVNPGSVHSDLSGEFPVNREEEPIEEEPGRRTTKNPPYPPPTLVDVSSPDGDARREARSSSVDAAFDEWYAEYPLKKAPTDARKAYEQVLRKTDAATLLSALRAQRAGMVAQAEEAKSKGEKRIPIPYPASWLRRGHWADEPMEVRDTRSREQRLYDEGYR